MAVRIHDLHPPGDCWENSDNTVGTPVVAACYSCGVSALKLCYGCAISILWVGSWCSSAMGREGVVTWLCNSCVMAVVGLC